MRGEAMQLLLILILIISIAKQETKADFGDIADDDGDFSCPAFTTCPVACAPSIEDCPMNITCPEGSTLCIDGNCAYIEDGGCASDLVNPCEYECAPVACMKIDDYFDNCEVIFGWYYDYLTKCIYFTWENLSQVNQTGPGFIVFYVWVSVNTLFVFMWCAFNQRFKPIEGSTVNIQEAVTRNDKVSGEVWTQTFYRTHFVGNIIYFMTMVTMIAFHVLLGIFTVFYYWTEQGILTEYEPIYADETQVLFIFIVIWMTGFFWSLAFKWNPTVRFIFLRRCVAHQATQVALFAPHKDPTSLFEKEKRRLSYIQKTHQVAKNVIGSIGMFLFSDVNRPDALGSITICPVLVDKYGCKAFSFRLRRYIFDDVSGKFAPGHISAGDTINELVDSHAGLTTNETNVRRQAVGLNIMDLPEPNFLRILINEYNKPFYHYQIYMIWTWFPLWYFYMAAVNAFVVAISGISVSYYNYRNEKNLLRLAKVRGTANVLKNGAFEEVDHTELVPGDIVQIEAGSAYSDMAIISGEHILADESALTGETSPISKICLEKTQPDQAYDPVLHKRSTIFAGTTVVEAEGSNLAVITKTGSFTAKGELVRDILSYRRHIFKFDIEVQLVIILLFMWAIVCFSIVLWFLEDEPVYSWFYGMFVISTCIPILLPTVFVASVGISANRLSMNKIACSNPDGILVAGKVKIAFFDKTGTLTKQGLYFNSVRSMENWKKGNITIPNGWLSIAMSVCHSITFAKDGEVIGNSLDKAMYKTAKATLTKNDNAKRIIEIEDGTTFEVVKQFEFDHHRMTQSVIIKDAKDNMVILVKGSTENIKTVCMPDSLPLNFDDATKENANAGLYQISMAMKILPRNAVRKYNNGVLDINRDEVEAGLSFLGFVNFKNVLKKDSASVLKQLKEGDIKTIMLTGDNVRTGIKIARESGMIEDRTRIILGDEITSSGEINWHDTSTNAKYTIQHINELDFSKSTTTLAVTGTVWRHLLDNNQQRALQLAEHICVYGRCTPFDKVSVVSSFVYKGKITLMCGDGGNDCGALKTAHVGIALSDAEASIVSPFTSLDKSISSVVDVLKEGRCALASAFSSYKFILMYGNIATINQMGTAWFYTTFSEWAWIFLDGVWLVTFVFSLPLAKPADVLAPIRPTSSLFGWQTMSSFLGVLVINLFHMVIALAILFGEDWFLCRIWGSVDVLDLLPDNYETEVIFLITGFQYIISAVVYNFGFMHRATWIKNYILVIFVLVFTSLHMYITLVPGYLSCIFRVNCDNEHVVREITTLEPLPIANPFHTTVMPFNFRLALVSIMIVNLLSVTFWEYYFINILIPKMINRYKRLKSMSKIEENKSDEFESDLDAAVVLP